MTGACGDDGGPWRVLLEGLPRVNGAGYFVVDGGGVAVESCPTSRGVPGTPSETLDLLPGRGEPSGSGGRIRVGVSYPPRKVGRTSHAPCGRVDGPNPTEVNLTDPRNKRG